MCMRALMPSVCANAAAFFWFALRCCDVDNAALGTPEE